MARCNYCETTILFGGVKDGNHRYCNQSCYDEGMLAQESTLIPEAVVQRRAYLIRHGGCPHCQSSSLVDAYTSYQITSFFVVTTTKTLLHISCQECGRKEQMKSLLMSMLLGWWGVPVGFFLTPLYVIKNIAAMGKNSLSKPSMELVEHARMMLATEYMNQAEYEDEVS